MRHAISSALFVSAALLFGLQGVAHAELSIGVSVGFFHDSLTPYGSWVDSPRYGSVWAPRHVSHGWRPYRNGRWVYTDVGWTWVSSEPWGWATYHYGRWYLDPREGWVWVPGDEWAPAWVDWRYGNDYVGWAPLPPEGDPFQGDLGYGSYGYGDRQYGYGVVPDAYSFVPVRSFCDPGVYREVVPVSRNVVLFRETRPATHYARVGDRVINRGIEPQQVQRLTGRAVPRAAIRDVAAAPDAGRLGPRGLQVFRPQVQASRRVDPTAGGRVVAGAAPIGRQQQQATRRQQQQAAQEQQRAAREQQRVRQQQEQQATQQRDQATRRQQQAQRQQQRQQQQAVQEQQRAAREQQRVRQRQEQQAAQQRDQAARRQQQAERQQQAAHRPPPQPQPPRRPPNNQGDNKDQHKRGDQGGR